MEAIEFFKQSFPTIEFKDKWDTQIRQFSADDMVEFAERFADKISQDSIREVIGEAYDRGFKDGYNYNNFK